MSQPAKAREPSMEEILASIRRIIADDDAVKNTTPATDAAKPGKAPAAAAAKPSSPAPAKAAPAPKAVNAPSDPPAAVNSQDDIDALFATLDAAPAAPEPEPAPVAPQPSSRRTAPEAAPPRTADIFDLTEDMRTPSPPPPTFRKVEVRSDVVFTEDPDEPDPPPEPLPRHPVDDRPPAPKPRVQALQPSFDEEVPPELLSSSTKSAVDSAFNALAQTVLVHNARTLEDLVREMLRPMLKSWLDENLPHMVERLVRAEIERVSRGRS